MIILNKKVKSKLDLKLIGKLNYDLLIFFELVEILMYFKNRNNELK